MNRAYVEIGNVCNLACSFCPGTKRPPHQMSEAEFRTVAKRLKPYTDYLYFHVMGEPLLHPKLDAFLSIAAEYGFRVCITTNGTLLPSCTELLLSHQGTLHKVSVSLHSMEGNNPCDVSEVTLGKATEEYLKSVIFYAKRAAEVGIYTVLRLWNLDGKETKGKHQANDAILAYLHSAFPGEWTVRWNGARLSRNIFLEYAETFTWPTESVADAEDDGYCHGLLDQIAVLADGTVVPCCLDSEGQIALGNLFESDLDVVLSSDRAVAMREGFLLRKMVEPLCKTCTYARRFSK